MLLLKMGRKVYFKYFLQDLEFNFGLEVNMFILRGF